MRWLQKIPLLVLVCLVAVFLDQATKFWAVDQLTRAFEIESAETFEQKLRAYRVMKYLEPLRRSPVTVVEGFWRFRYLENPGAAWGVLGSVDPSLRLPFFRSAPLIATVVLAFLYFRAARRQWLLRFSLALIVGGALGNFVDRWVHGYVVDFVDWNIGSYHWPTFNVADVFISLGLMGVGGESLFAALRRRRRAREEARAAAEAEALGTSHDETRAVEVTEFESDVFDGPRAESEAPDGAHTVAMAATPDPSVGPEVPLCESEESRAGPSEPIATEGAEGGESGLPSEIDAPERARSD